MKQILATLSLFLVSLGEPTPEADRSQRRPSHWCAAACVGPCSNGGQCDCDGRTCLVDLIVPGVGPVRTKVENWGLSARKTPCFDRPLAKGKTFRRDSGITDLAIWICNDPECSLHRGVNGDFRAESGR